MEELRYDGRVAIVTGAGRGIGREHALLLARRGASVVVNDVGGTVAGSGTDATPAADVVAEIAAAGGRAIANTASVSDEAGAQSIVDDAVRAFGSVDIVINNAGNQIVRPLQEMTLDHLRRTLDTHVVGAFLVTKAAWPHLKTAADARVVNTTSTASLGIPGFSSYSPSKSALIGLTRTLALEGAEYGIGVNAVAPSAATRMAFADDIVDSIPPEVQETMKRTSPPSLVSPVVLFLAHTSCTLQGEVLFAGAGRVTRIVLAETLGFTDTDLTVEGVASHLDQVLDGSDLLVLPDAMQRARAWARRNEVEAS